MPKAALSALMLTVAMPVGARTERKGKQDVNNLFHNRLITL